MYVYVWYDDCILIMGKYLNGPFKLLLSLHIPADIQSEIRHFADDCVCYCEIKELQDTLKFQWDTDRLGNWTSKWGMRFQPVKFNIVPLTGKLTNKIQASLWLLLHKNARNSALCSLLLLWFV